MRRHTTFIITALTAIPLLALGVGPALGSSDTSPKHSASSTPGPAAPVASRARTPVSALSADPLLSPDVRFAARATRPSSPAAATPARPTAGLVALFDGMSASAAGAAIVARTGDFLVESAIATDEQGRLQPNQLRLTVAKRNHHLVYHLSSEARPLGGEASYGGYRALSRTKVRTNTYWYGAGRKAPLAGNGTDAFVVVTSEISTVRSTVLSSSTVTRPAVTVAARAARQATRLPTKTGPGVSVGTVPVGTANVVGADETLALSRTLTMTFRIRTNGATTLLWQYADPAGRPIGSVTEIAPITAYAAGPSTNCAAVGENVGWFTGQYLNTIAGAGAIGTAVNASAAQFVPPAFIVTGGQGAAIAVGWGVIFQTVIAGTKSVFVPAYSSLAEAACEFVSAQPPTLEPPDIDRPDQPGSPGIRAQVVLVCDEWGSEGTGSSGYIDGDGNVVVIGHSEVVCTSWHFETIISQR